jgi:two-component system copper resistance phosphate regulon response regulator CusR
MNYGPDVQRGAWRNNSFPHFVHFQQMRLLIIEDEKRVSQFLKKGFQEEGYTVDVAADGGQGITAALTGTYDAIILDVMLPRRSGLDVLAEVRREKIATPVLILSARAEVEHRVEGLNLGADDYLAKPFAFSEVLARVRSLVRRQTAGEAPSSVLRLADLVVDVPAHTVVRGVVPIPQTSREFQVLEYLLRSRGRVLSRVVLMEHIWAGDFDSGTNIVDAVINRLRRKVDDPFAVKLIHTVRGVGYVMKEGTDETP